MARGEAARSRCCRVSNNPKSRFLGASTIKHPPAPRRCIHGRVLSALARARVRLRPASQMPLGLPDIRDRPHPGLAPNPASSRVIWRRISRRSWRTLPHRRARGGPGSGSKALAGGVCSAGLRLEQNPSISAQRTTKFTVLPQVLSHRSWARGRGLGGRQEHGIGCWGPAANSGLPVSLETLHHPDVATLRSKPVEEHPAAVGGPHRIVDAGDRVVELKDRGRLAGPQW